MGTERATGRRLDHRYLVDESTSQQAIFSSHQETERTFGCTRALAYSEGFHDIISQGCMLSATYYSLYCTKTYDCMSVHAPEYE